MQHLMIDPVGLFLAVTLIIALALFIYAELNEV